AIRLPDLDRGIVDRFAIGIDHASLDAHAIARHARRRDVLDHHPLEPDAQVRADGLRSAGAQAHRRFSIGVASRPRSTTSKRYASAYSGMVFSQSKSEMSRLRAFSSATQVNIGS